MCLVIVEGLLKGDLWEPLADRTSSAREITPATDMSVFLKSRSHSRNAGLPVSSKRTRDEESWPSSYPAPMCRAAAVRDYGE